jgi:hypothetical protein
MKKMSLLLALAVALVALPKVPAYADASQQGCESSDGQAAGCSSDPVSVPEPGSFALLATGMAAVGSLAIVRRRKRLAQN